MNFITSRKRKHIIKTVFLCLLIVSCSFSQQANSSRAFFSDNAYLTTYGYLELEVGFSKLENKFSIPTSFKLTPLKNFETSLFISGILEGTDSDPEFGTPGIKLKYQFLNTDNFATTLSGKFTFYNLEEIENTFNLSIQYDPDYLQIIGNLGITSYNFDYSDYVAWFYSILLSSKLNFPINPFIEFHNIHYDTFDKPIYLNFGILFSISNDLIFDSSYSIGLNEDEDWMFKVGMTKTLLKLF